MANEELHSQAALASRAVYDDALEKAHTDGVAEGEAAKSAEVETLKGTLASFQNANEDLIKQLNASQDSLAAAQSALMLSRADVAHLTQVIADSNKKD